MTKAIYFDMDGTIADLYGVENWLDKLINHDPAPYLEAAPLLRLCTLARLLNKLQRKGYTIGVVSWLSKENNLPYNATVTAAKYKWLANHLPSVNFDEIKIVPYGTPKGTVINSPDGILFDDEEKNRIDWPGTAFDVHNIIEVLRGLN